MLSYYNYVWNCNNFFVRESFLEELSPSLQEELNLRISGKLVQSVPLFKDLHAAWIGHIVSRLRQELYLKGDIIIREQAFGREVCTLYLPVLYGAYEQTCHPSVSTSLVCMYQSIPLAAQHSHSFTRPQ